MRTAILAFAAVAAVAILATPVMAQPIVAIDPATGQPYAPLPDAWNPRSEDPPEVIEAANAYQAAAAIEAAKAPDTIDSPLIRCILNSGNC